MSTNDTVLLLASGAVGKDCLAAMSWQSYSRVHKTAIELATQIPDDGEGATHLIEIEVRGTRTRDEARGDCTNDRR